MFSDDFSDATEAIQKKYGATISQRIEDWLPSIKDNFQKSFALLAFENSGPEIYISFFEQVLRGNINPTHFVHAYESLLEPERQLYPDLKMQIESEADFKDLLVKKKQTCHLIRILLAILAIILLSIIRL